MKTRVKIKGFDGYEIDIHGNIWSRRNGVNQSGRLRQMWELLSPTLNDAGYLVVRLSNPRKRKTARLHRLLAEAFLPNPSEKPFVCHKNGKRNDNRLQNLYWGTQRENMADRIIHGTSNRGERHGMAKLANFQVLLIKKALLLGINPKRIAAVVGCSAGRVRDIRCGADWAWLKTGWENII